MRRCLNAACARAIARIAHRTRWLTIGLVYRFSISQRVAQYKKFQMFTELLVCCRVEVVELVKLQRQRAVDAVYEALRSAIIDSLLRPGERLNVEELATKLGVSLTPVRSAIQQLATEGLV